MKIFRHHLENLSNIAPDIIFDIRYATVNNPSGIPLYAKSACYVATAVARALQEVQKELSPMRLRLKVFDGYRPLSVQQIMWDAIHDERYVSNPAKDKGRHTRGTAVDVTLADESGCELEMPTPFDDFTEKAHSDYQNVSQIAHANRALLKKVMENHHFQQLPTEWWHFDFNGWHDDARFPPLDIPLEELP
jgi:D-alanyl-D-alanine dipeptidase